MQLSVIVKARWGLPPEGTPALAPPPPLRDSDVHALNNPGRSVVEARDAVPYRSRADVTLVGHVHSHGEPTTERTVRFALEGPQGPLFDKAIVAKAPRATGGDPVPFDKLEIAYERAYGGPGHPDNPLGTGLMADDDPPCFLVPDEPEAVAGFGPIGESAPRRRGKRGKLPATFLNDPIVDLPDDFDWEFFQAAPLDQQTAFLSGQETLTLVGLHPHGDEVVCELPGVRAAAVLFDESGQRREIPLHIDTLQVDADQSQVVITWRGHVETVAGADTSQWKLAADVGDRDRDLSLPQTAPEGPSVPASEPARRPSGDFESTVGMDMAMPVMGTPTPFESAGSTPPPRRAAPQAGPAATPFDAAASSAPPAAAEPAPPAGAAPVVAVVPASPWASRGLASSARPGADAVRESPASAPLGAPGASPAPSVVTTPATLAEAPKTAVASKAGMQLLWFDARCLAPLRAVEGWSEALEASAAAPTDPALAEHARAAELGTVEDYCDVAAVLGDDVTPSPLRAARERAVVGDGVLVPPMVRLDGRLELLPDPAARLRVTADVASSLCVGDDGMDAAVAAARALLEGAAAGSSTLVRRHLDAIDAAYLAASGAPDAEELHKLVARILVDGRQYWSSEVFGLPHVLGTLEVEAGAPPLDVYLRADVVSALPLERTMSARMLGELRPPQDTAAQGVALRVMAIGRTLSPWAPPPSA